MSFSHSWSRAASSNSDQLFFNKPTFDQNIGGWNTASVSDVRPLIF
jgi:hypothetical protein